MLVTLPYCPHSYQARFHAAPARFRMAVGGRRSGKSYAALHEIVRHCLEVPKANAWYVAQTLSRAREVGWDSLQDFLDLVRPAVKRTNDTRMLILFSNGSRLSFRGAENENALRGSGLTFVVLDEAAFVAREVWARILRPALADRKGRGVICSSPNGLNWFHELWLRAQKAPTWATFRWPSKMNPLMTPAELADARAMCSGPEFAQEYEAEFVTRAGQVYADFGEENLVAPFSPKAVEHNVYLGFDPGFAGHSAVTFLAVPRDVDYQLEQPDLRVTVFDEIYAQRRDTNQIVSDILRVLGRHGLRASDVRRIYIDPAGNAPEQRLSGLSPANALERAGFFVASRKSEIAPGLELVRSFILSASGRRRLFVTRNCVETIRSLRGYSYAMGRNGEPREEPEKDGLHDHACDALRYALVNKWSSNNDAHRFLRLAQL